MELHPHDLGTTRYISLLRRRLTPATPQGGPYVQIEETPPSPPRSRRLRRVRQRVHRYWLRDMKLDEATGEKLASLLSRGTPGVGMRVGLVIVSIYLLLPFFISMMASGPAFLSFTFFLAWALSFAALLSSPRKALKQANEKPLTVTEVEAMLPAARGRLERNYLQLILDALRQDVPSSTAQSDIKAALRDLGDAISRLPADAVPVPNPGALRADADQQRRTAALENDSFIRASMLRQADTLERRAAVADQNGLALRRIAVLRREARTQMDALRSVLVAFENTSQMDHASAGQLTEALSRAAGEAQAVAIARRELEDDEIASLFGGPVPTPQPVQQQAAPVPQPQNHQVQTQPSTPQPQVVQSRQWWRNGGGGSGS